MNHQPNIAPEEAAKFERIANEWWDPDGPMKPLHQMNPVRLDYIKKQTALTGKTIIDVGSGGGLLSESLAKEGACVTGLDITDSLIEVAKQHAEKNHLNITYLNSTIEDYAHQHPNSCDIITCLELLEHVPDPANCGASNGEYGEYNNASNKRRRRKRA